MRFAVFFLLAELNLIACTAVVGERIRAGEIASAIPAFEILDKSTDLGPAPSPSVKRILGRGQLVRMAATEGLSVVGMPEHLCIERQQQPLTKTIMSKALEQAVEELFPGQKVRLELLDFVQHSLPTGILHFQRQGVVGGPTALLDGPILWRGTLTTGEKRRVPIWAKARILVSRNCWSSPVELPAGSQPDPTTLKLAQRWLNPFLPSSDCADPNRPFRLRRTFRAGQLLLSSDLINVPAVRRGEPVQASLAISNATLSFPATAETDGEEGQAILIRHDGRRLRARIKTKGFVQIMPGGSH